MTAAILKKTCKSKWSSKMTHFDPCPLPIAISVALMQDSAKSGAAPARGRCKMKGFFQPSSDAKMPACLLLALSKLRKSTTWTIIWARKSSHVRLVLMRRRASQLMSQSWFPLPVSSKSLFCFCCVVRAMMALFSPDYRSSCRPKRTTYLRQITEFRKVLCTMNSKLY